MARLTTISAARFSDKKRRRMSRVARELPRTDSRRLPVTADVSVARAKRQVMNSSINSRCTMGAMAATTK